MNPHFERHTAARTGWLRAAVLGANDGLVSTASLMVGVAASGATGGAIVTAGLAGVAAGAMAMAARPLQAAMASASSFLAGGVIPFLGLLAPTVVTRLGLIVAVTLVGLVIAGALGAKAAGAGVLRPAVRVVLGGGLAMAVTAGVGQLVHITGI